MSSTFLYGFFFYLLFDINSSQASLECSFPCFINRYIFTKLPYYRKEVFTLIFLGCLWLKESTFHSVQYRKENKQLMKLIKKIIRAFGCIEKKWFIRKRRISTSVASTTELYIGDPTQTTIHALKVKSQQFRWITR